MDVRISAKDGFVVGMENNVFTILDTTLTPELVNEGMFVRLYPRFSSYVNRMTLRC